MKNRLLATVAAMRERLTAMAPAIKKRLTAMVPTTKERLMAMALALAVALAGLGLSLLPDSTDAQRILGVWSWELELGDTLGRRLTGSGSGREQTFAPSRFELVVHLDFQPDGVYALQVDPAAFDAAMDGFMAEMTGETARYLEDLAARSGMSLDDVLAAAGVTLDDLMAALRQQLDDEMALSRATLRGRYRMENKQLFLSPDPDMEPDPEEPIDYAFRGNRQLRLAGGPGAKALLERLLGPDTERLLPMVLTR